MHILFDYPWYCVLPCLLAGAVYAWILYRKGKNTGTRSADSGPEKRKLAFLSVARFLSVSLIALLLLAPVVKRDVHTHDKPVIVVAQDVSTSCRETSIALTPELKKLEGRFDVVFDTFGGSSTDIAAALADAGDRYAGRNLGAMVLVTDGIYNMGRDPAQTASNLAVPIYTVALGDTTQRRDAWVSDVRCNRVAYKGSQFPIEVTIRATQLQGEQSILSITHNGKTLYSKPIPYSDKAFSQSVTVPVDADLPGLQAYTIAISPCRNELTTANNSRTVAVEVLDGRRKVAIVAATAHPDIAALRQAIESNPDYEVEVFTGAETKGVASELKNKYDLLVLHNLPRQGVAPSDYKGLFEAIKTIPTIFVVGTQTDLPRFNALHSGLEITAKSRHNDEVTAARNNAFALFAADDDASDRIEKLPPLSAPFGTYRTAANVQTLYYAKVGGQATERPLIAFCQQADVRRAFVAGEGLWRWRLHCWQMTGSHDDFDQLIERMVVYTGTRGDRERLHVTAERIYRENEPVTLQAEFYDDNYELTNKPAVQCTLQSKETQPSKYDFNPSGSGYTLALGTLTAGHYSYHASTTFAGKNYTASGSFIVEALDLEQLSMVADHTLLNTIAQTSGAQMLSPGDIGNLADLLADRDDMKSIIYTHKQYTPLLDLPLLFILIILLLAIEWAGRKYLLNSN